MEEDNETASTTELSWGQRHGLTVMLVVMAAMFALVVIVQMLE